MVGFFIQRPVFASAIAIIMVLAGGICYFLLPVGQFPNITPPQIVVAANYPGASAQVVADTVTTPLEQQLNGVPGMLYMSSTSSNDGSSRITISFEVGYPIDVAAMDVQNRVSQAAPSLPALVNQSGVTVVKQNPNFTVLVNIGSPDNSVDFTTLSNYAYLQVLDPLKRVPGVGDVFFFGERRYSMRVWLDPDKLSNLGITAVDVQNAIAEQNVQVAAGKIGQSPAPRHRLRNAGQCHRAPERSGSLRRYRRARQFGRRVPGAFARRRPRRARLAALCHLRLPE
jgi:multidrug efflux pump subunit AcrB